PRRRRARDHPRRRGLLAHLARRGADPEIRMARRQHGGAAGKLVAPALQRRRPAGALSGAARLRQQKISGRAAALSGRARPQKGRRADRIRRRGPDRAPVVRRGAGQARPRKPDGKALRETLMQDAIVKAFDESIRVKQAFLRDNLATLTQAIDAIIAAFKNGRKLLLFGNGGSAADAQHIAAEFTNRFLIERPPLPALALTTDTSALTAIANDYEYTQIFSKQIEALGKAGDIALAISTSGNSPNVLAAIAACKKLGIATTGLTGGGDTEFFAGGDRREHVGRVAAGGNCQRDVSRFAQRFDLLGKNLRVIVVVGDGGERRGVGGERQRRQGRPLDQKAIGELRGD